MEHTPAHEVELYREEDAYVVIAELPGVPREAIEVSWTDGRIHLSAERADGDGATQVYHRSMSFHREVAPEEITAEYEPEDGVLEVRLPIRDDRHHGMRVEVREKGEGATRASGE